MHRFRTLRLFEFRRVVHLSRKMSKFSVRCVEHEEILQISLEYENRFGASRTFNACRPKKENVGNSLSRLAQNINKHIGKKKKGKAGSSIELQEVVLDLYESDGTTKVESTESAENGLRYGNIVSILDKKYVVDVNPPSCIGIVVPKSIMVGFPVFPQLDVEFCSLDDSEYVWEKIKYEETANSGAQLGKPVKPDPSKIIDRKEISRTFSYTPTNDDIGYRLAVTCIPKLGDRVGRPLSAESKFEVTTGPGVCPFETRHLYTQNETQSEEIRVISYNVLADIYADQDYSRDVLYSYCPPYALAIDYRKHLLIKELQGYHGDILCLQEVDSKVFRNEFSSALEAMGFDGAFKEKSGGVREGSAIFFRKSRFRLVCEHYEKLGDLLTTNSICKDIVKKAYSSSALKQVLETRTTILHIVALEPVDAPGKILLVANTHLYFHPDAGHIRMIQVLVAMRYIESLLHQYRDKKPSLIFCGDFNSLPERAIYEFMTTKSVKEDNIDWKDGGDEQFVPDMNFSHSLNIDSGCGKVAYTNYTSGFHGHLDYIYYDTDSFQVSQVIPPPDHKDVEFHTALPSIVFPSDHIAQICDFKWKNTSQ